jgi:uncharacterized protein
MKKKFLLLPVLFVVSFCFAQNDNSNCLLWRIENKNSTTTSYLFGTIHLPQKKFVIYSDSVYTAIQNSDTFYNELDFLHQPMFGGSSMQNFFEEKKQHIDSVRKTEGWKRLIDKVNKKYGVHLSYDSLEQFTSFSQRFIVSIYEPEEGMTLPDVMLATYALMLGKTTAGLETFQLQLNMIYEILDARLKDTTMELEDEAELTANLKKFYVNEQTDSISKLIEAINPSYREIVFDRRNKTMADSIEKHSHEESSFYAIGVGHLCGHHGVIELLRKKGFTVTPVHSENKISLMVINNILRMSSDYMRKVPTSTNKVKKDDLDDIDLLPPPPPRTKNIQISKPNPMKKKSKN